MTAVLDAPPQLPARVDADARPHPLLTRPVLDARPDQSAAALEPQPAEDTAQTTLRPITAAVKFVIGALSAFVLALFADGMVASFRSVRAEMTPWFGSLAWTVPTGIDVGIFVFSGLDLLLAYLELDVWWLRWVPRLLTAGTISLNEAAGGSSSARLAHVLLPSLAIVAVEVAVRVVRKRTGLENGTRRESIPLARWMLSPVATFRLWRRMVLWRINSYQRALDMEFQRLSGETRAREFYGSDWKDAVPGEVLFLLELGKIGAADIPRPGQRPWWSDPETVAQDQTSGPGGDRSRDRDQDDADRSGTGPDPNRRRSRTRSGTGRRGTGRGAGPATPDEPQDVLDAAVEVARELIRNGHSINRGTLRTGLAHRQIMRGNSKIGPLLAYVKDEVTE